MHAGVHTRDCRIKTTAALCRFLATGQHVFLVYHRDDVDSKKLFSLHGVAVAAGDRTHVA